MLMLIRFGYNVKYVPVFSRAPNSNIRTLNTFCLLLTILIFRNVSSLCGTITQWVFRGARFLHTFKSNLQHNLKGF